VYAEHCARLWYIIQHRVVLIPPLLQAVISVQMLPRLEKPGVEGRVSVVPERDLRVSLSVGPNYLYSASEKCSRKSLAGERAQLIVIEIQLRST